MAQRSLRRPTQWMAAMSYRRHSLSGPACAWTPLGFCLWGVPFPIGELPERGQSLTSNRLRDSTPDFFSWLSPEVFFTSGYLRQTAVVWIRVFTLLGELPKAIELLLPVCQLYRWQLGHNMWSSPTTKLLDPIVVTALRVGFPLESHGHATCGFACNYPNY